MPVYWTVVNKQLGQYIELSWADWVCVSGSLFLQLSLAERRASSARMVTWLSGGLSSGEGGSAAAGK